MRVFAFFSCSDYFKIMSRSVRVFTILVVMIIVSCLLLSQYKINEIQHDVEEAKIEGIDFLDWNKTMKTILYWNPMYTQPDFYLGVGSQIFQDCVYKNCYTTYNKSHLPIDEYDAIIFHGVQYTKKSHGVPAERAPHQMYIFFCQESPLHTPKFIKVQENFYNWTMTYRLDSDIMRPYAFVEKERTNYQLPSVEEVRKRPKKIAWMVSHCTTPSDRERVYSELKKLIQVDVYGTCGDLECPKNKGSECYDMIEKEYKFYLSFENSICTDYVTEKLYNILGRNLIPIVYGGANYTKVAPPNSVINVMDFKSLHDLVRYIEYLDSHPEEYLKYFQWKKDYVIAGKKQTLCSMCQKLNEPIEPKMYKDMARWWRGENFNMCSDNRFVDKIL